MPDANALGAPAARPLPAGAGSDRVDDEAIVDLDDLVPTERTPTLVERVQAFRARHARGEIALFFFGGFLWDVFTLGRIDNAATPRAGRASAPPSASAARWRPPPRPPRARRATC